MSNLTNSLASLCTLSQITTNLVDRESNYIPYFQSILEELQRNLLGNKKEYEFLLALASKLCFREEQI
jgi:hypothetical protein